MHCEIRFPEMDFGAWCLCVMWSDVIVYFCGFMHDVKWLDVVWSRCGRVVVVIRWFSVV